MTVRLGSTTIAIEDRSAALSVASAAVWFEDAADRLGPTYAGREGYQRPGEDATSLVVWAGMQAISDHHITPGYRVADCCGTASLTIGHVRITACDRRSASRVRRGGPLRSRFARSPSNSCAHGEAGR